MPLAPFIIPVFIPQAGCPHQCVFCNQEAITATGRETDFALMRTRAYAEVRRFLAFKRDKRRLVELAFFGGNFLGLEPYRLKWYLGLARSLYKAGLIHALRFSTRPDTVSPFTLSLLQGVPVSVVELGAQSMHNEVLNLAGRGHTVSHTVLAAGLLKEFGFNTGLQIMPGLPGDTPELALSTGQLAAKLKPLCVRIYPTLVLKGSPLAHMYQSGAYHPWELEQAVNVTAALYRLFSLNNITVIRMGLQAASELAPGASLLAGPYHPAFGHLVISRLFLEKITAVLGNTAPVRLNIYVHKSQISHLRGLKNVNMEYLTANFPQARISVKTDDALNRRQVKINGALHDILT